MNKTIKVVCLLPYMALYIMAAVLWDMARAVSGWVWAREHIFIPARYRHLEVRWIMWLLQWPSMNNFVEVVYEFTNKE